VTPVHAWVYFTGALHRYGPQGTGTIWLARYMLELAVAHHTDPTRPVWLQEFGMSSTWAAPDIVEHFPSEVLATLDASKTWGATWWSSHDISTSLGGFLPLEHDLGLLTVDNRAKASGEAFRQAVTAARSTPSATPDIDRVGVILPTGTEPDLTFADSFFELIDGGMRPAIVLQERAHDTEYLRERGIAHLVHPGSVGMIAASERLSLDDIMDPRAAHPLSDLPTPV